MLFCFNADDDEEIEFYISRDLLGVVKIEGDEPVDYNINPGGDFILLSQAITAATQSVDGSIGDWELEYDGNRWVYDLEYEYVRDENDDDIEILVDAFNGNVLGVYRDDFEDDDEVDDINDGDEHHDGNG